MNKDLKELERKYQELGKEIEALKEQKSELPKSWEELKTIQGYWIDGRTDINKVKNAMACAGNKYVFPTKEEAEASIALAQLCQLRDRYNGDWKPNWEDDDYYKYSIVYINNTIHKQIFRNSHAILAFKTEELMNEFLTNFRDLIETAKPLL